MSTIKHDTFETPPAHVGSPCFFLHFRMVRLTPPHLVAAGWLGGLVAGWWVGWLAGWLAGWMAGWLVGWLVGWLAGMVNWFRYHKGALAEEWTTLKYVIFRWKLVHTNPHPLRDKPQNEPNNTATDTK